MINLTLNFSCTTTRFTLKIELAKVTVKTIRLIDTVMAHLRLAVQLLGQLGSLGPWNSTKKRSVSVVAGASSPEPFSMSREVSLESLVSSFVLSASAYVASRRGLSGGGAAVVMDAGVDSAVKAARVVAWAWRRAPRYLFERSCRALFPEFRST